MDKLIIASMRPNGGKTGLIVGLGRVLGRKIGYMKPLGDRLLYRKKQLWDHDASLMTTVFGLAENPMDMSLGFDHAKLRFMYNEESTKAKLLEAVAHIETDREVLFIEGGRDIGCGISVYLDPVSVAEQVGGKLVVVVGGDENDILDDITFLKQRVDLTGIEFGGVIINKLADLENFKDLSLPLIEETGVEVLGLLPFAPELNYYSVGYLADRLFAKVVVGASGLNNTVQTILVGAMSVQAALRDPAIKMEHSLMITGGDRTDLILAALENKAVGIILTNNIVPPSNIIAKASERQTPLLLVNTDTYQTARQIDDLQPLLTRGDTAKIELWEQLVRQHVSVERIVNT
jgi:BioD-like phosphotransacetylase family protein